MTPEQAKAILEPKIFIVEDLPHDDKVILYEDAIDLLSEHSALKEQWISVEERLPEHNEMLVCCEIGRTKSFWASYDKRENVFICHEGFVVTVDYYKSLPAPPVKK